MYIQSQKFSLDVCPTKQTSPEVGFKVVFVTEFKKEMKDQLISFYIVFFGEIFMSVQYMHITEAVSSFFFKKIKIN